MTYKPRDKWSRFAEEPTGYLQKPSFTQNKGPSRVFEQNEASMNISTAQKWFLLEAMRRQRNIQQDDLEAMQKLIRDYAVLLVEQQPFQDKIMVGNQALIRFPNNEEGYASKADYVEKMSQDGAWLDDTIMCLVADSLGYQAVIHLKNNDDYCLPPYSPYVHQETDTPLRIDIVNDISTVNANDTSAGFHWHLLTKNNPGAGNCGAYTLAQQVISDFPKVSNILNAPERQTTITDIQQTLSFDKNDPDVNLGSFVNFELKSPVRESNEVTREVTKQFEKMDKEDNLRAKNAKDHLQQFSTSQLALIYQQLMTRDRSYLHGRIAHFKTETGGLDIAPLISGNKDLQHYEQQGLAQIVREELLHALSTESKRDPGSSDIIFKEQPDSQADQQREEKRPTLRP